MRGPETSAVPELEVRPSDHVTTRRNTTDSDASFEHVPGQRFLQKGFFPLHFGPFEQSPPSPPPNCHLTLLFPPSAWPTFCLDVPPLNDCTGNCDLLINSSRASAFTACNGRSGEGPVSAAFPRCPPLSRPPFCLTCLGERCLVKLIGGALDFRVITCRALVGPTVPTLAGNGSIVPSWFEARSSIASTLTGMTEGPLPGELRVTPPGVWSQCLSSYLRRCCPGWH